jgi:YfiH family protein
MSDRDLALSLDDGARVLFTARAEGNLSSVGGDRCAEGAAARERLRARLGLARLARGHQVHGTRVHVVLADARDETAGEREEADGQATALAGVGVMVLSADCVPVALSAPGAVAIVHAGWRGLAAGVLEQGVRTLRELAGAGTVSAAVGPCAGACCYEVGPEVAARFDAEHRDGRLLDLRGIARERLLAAGVRDARDARACTICDERFFSHRREGARAGRQAGIAWLS